MAYTGIPEAEQLGFGWLDRLHPDDRERTVAVWNTAVASNMPFDVEFRIRRHDGCYRWFKTRAVAVRDGEGRILRWFGTNTDIDDQRHMEQALRESEERFRATFEQAAVGIAQVGLDGHWLRVNQRLCDIVGYTREELLQCTFQDITHPDDLNSDLDYIRQVLAGEIQTYSMEKRYLRKDQSLVWVNLTVGLVRDPSGAPLYFVSVVEDIAARKRAQEELDASRRLLSSMINAITESAFLMAPDGTILHANEAVAHRLGATPGSMAGKNIYDLIPPDLALSRRQQIAEVIRSRVPAHFEDTRMGRHILNSIYPVLDQAGVARQVAIFGFDITERKQAEEALKTEKQRLEMASAAGNVALWDWDIVSATFMESNKAPP